MKKLKNFSVALVLAGMACSMTGCIGNFELTNSVLAWNKKIGPKFLNEVVFVAFWILPVYEVTGIADLLILNSIEFWSGKNPVTASVKAVDTDHGRYLIACDGKGYTVTHQPSGQSTRLEFIEESATWAVEKDGVLMPFMSYVDDTHIKAIMPDGDTRTIDLSDPVLTALK